MNHSSRPRMMSKLSESTQRRLQAYELAATAAGVGMLALAPCSEAKIIYSPAHKILNTGSQYKLDLSHSGVTDFTLTNLRCRSCGGGAVLSVRPAAGNGASGFATTGLSSGTWASALGRGALVGTRRYFPGKEMANVGTTGDGSEDVAGSWVNVKNRYLGLEFKLAGKTHYGWARLNVAIQNLSIKATLTGYAYETIPNKPIVTGRTKGPDVVTVAPRSLGALAAGASQR